MVPIPLNFIQQNTRWWAQINPGRNTHIPYVASILALAQFFLVSEIKSIHQSRALQWCIFTKNMAGPMSKIWVVGGFNHLEKYESQWEGLSHILCIMENKQCLKPPSSMKSPRGVQNSARDLVGHFPKSSQSHFSCTARRAWSQLASGS